MDLLLKERLGPNDLAARLDLPLKEIREHLEHVRKSVRPPQRFLVNPASCEKCGFVFKDRRKLHPPSRCPRCKSQSILDPSFTIAEASR